MSYQCDVCGFLVGGTDESHSSQHRTMFSPGSTYVVKKQDIVILMGGCAVPEERPFPFFLNVAKWLFLYRPLLLPLLNAIQDFVQVTLFNEREVSALEEHGNSPAKPDQTMLEWQLTCCLQTVFWKCLH